MNYVYLSENPVKLGKWQHGQGYKGAKNYSIIIICGSNNTILVGINSATNTIHTK